jgi:hypothetical protein
MKTAVIYSGHMRSFARCLPTQIDHVFRHFPGADFFVSTVKDADSHTAELLREKIPGARVEVEVFDCQPEIPIPVPPVAADWQAGQGRLYGHEPYAISVHPQAILRQLWHLQRAWEFFRSKVGPFHLSKERNPAQEDHGYDVIIRMRPDNYFRSFESSNTRSVDRHPQVAENTYSTQLVRVSEPYGTTVARTPWWGRFGGVNDRFAVLGAKAAEAYFTTFGCINDLIAKGYPLHPERLVYASLVQSGCEVDDTLLAEFSKLVWDRSPNHGTFRDPEITQIDIAHLAARASR